MCITTIATEDRVTDHIDSRETALDTFRRFSSGKFEQRQQIVIDKIGQLYEQGRLTYGTLLSESIAKVAVIPQFKGINLSAEVKDSPYQEVQYQDASAIETRIKSIIIDECQEMGLIQLFDGDDQIYLPGERPQPAHHVIPPVAEEDIILHDAAIYAINEYRPEEQVAPPEEPEIQPYVA